jgi:RNA-directed DNA polymerase
VLPEIGNPQGGIISPPVSNLYLHYALDLWFEKVVNPQCLRDTYLCRYADDHVCLFRYKGDAERFFQPLGPRMEKFGLELASDKTRILSFSRFRKEERTCFAFLVS